jgi:peroxiredoxin
MPSRLFGTVKRIDKKMNRAIFSHSLLKGTLLGMAMTLSVATTSGCAAGSGSSDTGGMTVIKGQLASCYADSIRLYEVLGAKIKPIAAAKFESKDGQFAFTLSLKLPHPGFYMIGDDPRRAFTVLLGDPGEFKLTGNCQNPANSYQLENAPLNASYQNLQQRVMQHNQKVQMLYQNLQVFQMSDPAQVQRIQNDLSVQNSSHFSWLDSLEKKGGIMGKVAKMYNFKPFMSDPSHSGYGSELEYFRQAFFNNLDLKDEETNYMPQIFDKARAFAGTLSSQPISEAGLKKTFDGVLAKSAVGSVAHESLLRGFIAGFEQSKSELYVDYGKIYVDNYKDDPQFAAAVNGQVSKMSAMRTGAEAPEIAQPDPNGKIVKLSDMRGKVVMIDFWASWCRPCRMENPNVVKAYNKYKSAGFEILGVSLDKEKEKWEDAIKVDGLTWKHVSDLQGWSSQPAALYSVTSIPATVLLDKDGKIIARNLRGPALEEKLKELFGF